MEFIKIKEKLKYYLSLGEIIPIFWSLFFYYIYFIILSNSFQSLFNLNIFDSFLMNLFYFILLYMPLLFYFIIMASLFFTDKIRNYLEPFLLPIYQVVSYKKINNIYIDFSFIVLSIFFYFIFSIFSIDTFLEYIFSDKVNWGSFILLLIFCLLISLKIFIIQIISQTHSFIRGDEGKLLYFLVPIFLSEVFFIISEKVNLLGDVSKIFPNILGVKILEAIPSFLLIVLILYIPFKKFFSNGKHVKNLFDISLIKDDDSPLLLGLVFSFFLFFFITNIYNNETLNSDQIFSNLGDVLFLKEMLILILIFIYVIISFYKIKDFSDEIIHFTYFEVEVVGSAIFLEEDKFYWFNLKNSWKFYKIKYNEEYYYFDNYISNPLFKNFNLNLLPSDEISFYGIKLDNDLIMGGEKNDFKVILPIYISYVEENKLRKIKT